MPVRKWIVDFFHLDHPSVSIKHEIIAGLCGYFSMVYIFLTIPDMIVSTFPGAADASGNLILTAVLDSGYTVQQLTATLLFLICILSGIFTIASAFLVKLPFAILPSLTLTMYFTITVCGQLGYSYGEVLAIIILSGLIFFIFSLFGVTEKLISAIPAYLKYALVGGLGMFLALAGLQKANIIQSGARPVVHLAQFAQLGYGAKINIILTFLAVILIAVLLHKKCHGSMLIGKLACFLAAALLGTIAFDSFSFSFSNIQLDALLITPDFKGLFSRIHSFSDGFPVFFSIILNAVFVDMFDSIGTILGMGYRKNLFDSHGLPERTIKNALLLDSTATTVGAVFGIPNLTVCAESTIAVEEQGRTGLTALVIGILFLLTSAFSPLVSLLPASATASTLIVIGAMMLESVRHIDFDDYTQLIPAFLTILMTPFSYSLAKGLAFGLFAHVVISLCTGRAKKIPLLVYLLTLFFLINFSFFYW